MVNMAEKDTAKAMLTLAGKDTEKGMAIPAKALMATGRETTVATVGRVHAYAMNVVATNTAWSTTVIPVTIRSVMKKNQSSPPQSLRAPMSQKSLRVPTSQKSLRAPMN